MSDARTLDLQTGLLAWADVSLRDLPWRRTRDPWAILVAETMLQQTQVTRVETRWAQFLDRFPDPSTCAASSVAEMLREWAGLGYNRRALMLHRAATAISDQHKGEVPADLEALIALPGVGPYTARAVLAFAFEQQAAPVDTNVGRVLARLGGEALSPAAAQGLADSLVPDSQSWIWNQGIMELGATVCRKRSPGCGGCPVVSACHWRGRGADPAEGSAGVSRAQSRFEGSDRQLRGRVIAALRDGRAPMESLDTLIASDDDERRIEVIAGLLADGLIEFVGGLVQLTHDDQDGPVRESSSASMA